MAKFPPSRSLPKDGICVIHLLWGMTDAQADDFRPQQLCRARSAPLPCVSRGCERKWDSRGHFWLTRKISLQDSLSNGQTSVCSAGSPLQFTWFWYRGNYVKAIKAVLFSSLSPAAGGLVWTPGSCANLSAPPSIQSIKRTTLLPRRQWVANVSWAYSPHG